MYILINRNNKSVCMNSYARKKKELREKLHEMQQWILYLLLNCGQLGCNTQQSNLNSPSPLSFSLTPILQLESGATVMLNYCCKWNFLEQLKENVKIVHWKFSHQYTQHTHTHKWKLIPSNRSLHTYAKSYWWKFKFNLFLIEKKQQKPNYETCLKHY